MLLIHRLYLFCCFVVFKCLCVLNLLGSGDDREIAATLPASWKAANTSSGGKQYGAVSRKDANVPRGGERGNGYGVIDQAAALRADPGLEPRAALGQPGGGLGSSRAQRARARSPGLLALPVASHLSRGLPRICLARSLAPWRAYWLAGWLAGWLAYCSIYCSFLGAVQRILLCTSTLESCVLLCALLASFRSRGNRTWPASLKTV